MKILEGTARNMGIAVKGVNDAELASQEKEALEEEKEQAEREAELAELEAETGKEAPEVPVIEEKKDSNEEA